ncbi:MAG: hypothetical protein KGO96_10390 [Elusimicrobia bacterium]|nr:hypothetical protein [Elusimicrobiota bacterium]
MMNHDRVLELASKLLHVQESRGASEAEASFASERLQQLLQEHNLTLSEVEARDGDTSTPAAKRTKEEIKRYSSKSQAWRETLLRAVAECNFCLPYSSLGGLLIVIGREINVTITKQTYEYLCATFLRLARDAGYPLWSKEHRQNFIYFMDGAVSRVSQRLMERRRQAELDGLKQRQAGDGSGTALILSDVYGSEADLNNDFLNNYPAGTTAARRREAQVTNARREEERQRLVSEGVDSTVAWYKVHGYSDERIAAIVADDKKRQRRRESRHNHGAHNWSRSDQAHYRKINSRAYKSGSEAGSSVGLDDQVGGDDRRRLT